MIEQIEFRNPARARDHIARLGAGIPERIVARMQLLLGSVPDPDAALHFLDRFRKESPTAFDRIASSPNALRYMVTTFAYSSFLSEAVLRHPEWLLQIASSDPYHVLTAEEYEAALEQFLGAGQAAAPTTLQLAQFRRRQILRILLRDVLGLGALSDITGELSNLADAILEVSYRRLREEMAMRHGDPDCGFCVIALGKLGGQELNYSSDIDLMFVYERNGITTGPSPITYKEFFKNLANACTQLLSTYSPEGMCYRVDLRLRPDGSLGEVVISQEGAERYYNNRARDWELQMLIKARVAAGDRVLGRTLLDASEPRIYSTTLDFRAVESVSETRARIGEKVAAKRRNAGLDIKLAPGGIRDIEFLVQCLQRLHGGREPFLKHGGTLVSLFRLRDKQLLSGAEYARLASAYQFLRNLEHRLQFYDDRQTHTLPADPDERATLARKMPAQPQSIEKELDVHLTSVKELYERVIHAQKPIYYSPLSYSPSPMPENPAAEPELIAMPASSNLERLVEQRAPQFAARFARLAPHRGRERFHAFLEKVNANPEWLYRLESDPELANRAVDLFEHSRHFGEQLIRYPELIEVLADGEDEDAPDHDAGALRRFFHRQMLRIQSQSISRCEPIFNTLARTSDLADAVIAAAYRLAVGNDPRPEAMMVIALGRLGLREFDLASDADLLFVIPDESAEEQLFWTGVAERIIQVISAYTGEGVMFTVDARLRPNGREGPLVQAEGAYKEYFARNAEAWEGISYMKARGVAGNVYRATEFLHELQDVDWRRYGQGGRSRKELAQMRARLEKEQAASNPLKAGEGGYYDIDFALMYLRLKGAGIFYKVLNTPERIDVIEKMGHLEREDADFLRDAATFYRAIDHGLRVSTGHAEGTLPTSPAQVEVLTELVRRWTPEHLHDARIDDKLRQIRAGTREFFNRLFGC